MKIENPFARRVPPAAAWLALVLGGLAAAPVPGSASLPDYRVGQKVGGVLRSRGNDQMATLMRYWEEGFQKFQPNVRFADALRGSATGMYGLEMRTADLAVMGRPINPYERYGIYERSWVYPVEIEVATGSAEAAAKSPAYAIFVHRQNPVAKITLKQLDGIFGAERRGGWTALSWDENAARPRSANIRTWGQLGVTGPLADKPIHVYAPPLLGAGVVTYFQTRVLAGGAMWNEDLREYADRKRMIADLGDDPYGIAYTALSYGTSGVKAVALAETEAGPFVKPTRSSVADRSYPLARPVYIVYTIDDEKAEFTHPRGDPRVKEFLRYILSRQGQAEVAREGAYLPLPPAVVKAQLRKLDSTEPPPERQLLQD